MAATSAPVCQITATGCARPTFAECLAYTQGMMRAIYGADVYLGADCQDGQLVVAWAQSIHDCNGETLAAYNAQSPSSAQGVGLSRIVKINGIRRKRATFSTCDFLVVGQAGTEVPAGVIRDDAGCTWLLAPFAIPLEGQIVVTATCEVRGAVPLAAGAVDTAAGRGTIANPTRGWQSAANLSAAAVGQPVESDSQLRQRQAISTAIPSRSLIEGLLGAVAAVAGVTRFRGYENDTDLRDADGLPGHAIALVVEGGDAATIAALIQRKKGPGVGTYGSTSARVSDAYGIPHAVAFSRPRLVPIRYALRVRPLRGYSADVEAAIAQALATWTDALGIGNPLAVSRAYAPILEQGDSFEVVQGSLTAARVDGAPTTNDVPMAFDEAAAGDPALVTITADA